MLIDNYSHPFLFGSNYDKQYCQWHSGPRESRGTVRNISTGPRTPMPWPMLPVEVSHMVPVEWLGKLHGEKNRCRTLVKGNCGCFGEVKGSKDGGLAWSHY